MAGLPLRKRRKLGAGSGVVDRPPDNDFAPSPRTPQRRTTGEPGSPGRGFGRSPSPRATAQAALRLAFASSRRGSMRTSQAEKLLHGIGSKKDNASAIEARVLHGRAVEAVIWGMPAVGFELMHRAMV